MFNRPNRDKPRVLWEKVDPHPDEVMHQYRTFAAQYGIDGIKLHSYLRGDDSVKAEIWYRGNPPVM